MLLKKILLIYVAVVFAVTLVTSCSSQNVYYKRKNGKYSYQIFKTQKTSSIVFGKIFEYETNSKVILGAIKLDEKEIIRADTNGFFHLIVSPGKHVFKGEGYPYLFLKAKKIKIMTGDSIKLNFYLRPNNQPFID